MMALLGIFLQADADTNAALNNSATQITYTTAAGQFLTNKAIDYGKSRSAGVNATANVVFYLDNPATATYTLPIGTVVGTAGTGVGSPQVQFVTTAVATISTSATASAVIPVVCTQPGSIGNVSATVPALGAITVISISPVVGLKVSNAASVSGVSNPNGAGVGGVDPDTDAQLRAKIASAVQPQYGLAALVAAIEAVVGVYDGYVLDPQTGSGFIYYYWAQPDGTAPTITGGSQVASGSPDFTTYISGATLSGLALAVDTALRAILPVGIVPRIGGAGSASRPFTLVTLTNVAYTYSAPAALQDTTIQALINAAIIAYVNGVAGSGFTPGLQHNQIPTQFGMSQAVQTSVGNSLSNFVFTASTPAVGAAAQTTLYRASNVISFTPTRV